MTVASPSPRPRQGATTRIDRYLDPRVLGRIGNLQVLAKTVVEGFVSGLHRSPFLGRSMDFAEYRSYLPGDDIRQIDWKLYSRSDRYYVKQFEGDTNTNLTVLMDASASMAYGGSDTTGNPSKIEYAKYLAASLGYLTQKQRDRIGLMVLGNGIRKVVPNGAKQLQTILVELDATRAEGELDLDPVLAQIAGGIRRRGLIALLSDLYEPSDQILRAVSKLQVRGADVVVFHILDPTEVALPFSDTVELEDLESGGRMAIEPEVLRDRYQERIQRHIAEVKDGLVRAGADYHLTMTDEPLDQSLHRYLSTRLWSMKSR